MTASSNETTTLSGRLIRKQVFGDWAVGVFEGFDNGQYKIVGGLVETLELLQSYELTVKEVQHPKHGQQWETVAIAPYIELERASISKHLVRNFNGVGPKTAQQIVHWYEQNSSLEELRKVLAHEPWKLHGFMTAGTSKAVEFIYQARTAYSYLYTLMATRFGATGVSDPVLRRLSKWLAEMLPADTVDPVSDAFKLLAQDPYKPIIFVWGYTFSDADKLAGVMGGKSDDPVRLGAMAFSALKACSANEGHTYIPLDLLRRRVMEIDFTANAKLAVEYAGKLGYPMVLEDGHRCYLTSLLEAENSCRDVLIALTQRTYPLRGFASEAELVSEIKRAEDKAGWGYPLDESQRTSVIAMLHAPVRLHTMTAGPGCGKTSTMEIFAQLAGVSVIFCAPTGKAAKVLHARVSKYGFKATTIHQALEPSLSAPNGFLRNADNPLEAAMVVIDEASMLELVLFAALLDALPTGAHLVLMGDDDQLESIGAGRVLGDVLTLDADHQRLSVTHRNDGSILALIREVRTGHFTSPGWGHESDLQQMQIDMKNEQSFDFVQDVYLDAIKRHGIQGTVLLVPNRKGKRDQPGWNTTYLNHRLQGVLNAAGEPVKGTSLRLGDRIIVRRNMELVDASGLLAQVVNGDTGHVLSQQLSDDGQLQSLRLLLDEGRTVELGREVLDTIELAFVMTVHSAQGSEYSCVLFAVGNGASNFLNRSVFYTAISRTKRELQMFGSSDHFSSIARRSANPRFSALANKVQERE